MWNNFFRNDQLLSHINLGLCSNTTDNHGASSSSQNIETNTGHIPTQFVDCGPTIKEEIKEENVEFHDPLRLSYAVQSLDEPVTYEEFFV